MDDGAVDAGPDAGNTAEDIAAQIHASDRCRKADPDAGQRRADGSLSDCVRATLNSRG